MPKPDYVVSDTHLGAVPQQTERAFLRFLEHVGENAATLLINGDLFDFWFEWGPVIQARHFRVLAMLADIVDAGIPVTMIGGNHDAWGGRFLSEEVGMRMHHGVLHTTLGGRKAVIAHGDGLGKGDIKYRMLKKTLRSGAAIWGFRMLHPEIGMRIVDWVSSTPEKALHDRSSLGRAAFLQNWAKEQFAADADLALVMCGHANVPAVIEMGSDRFYVNSGDWVRNRTYVTLQPGVSPQLLTWRDQDSV